MHISKVVRRITGIGFSMLSFVFLVGATSPAFAVDPTASIATNFPANTSVGDSFSASIVITNTGTCPPDCDDSVVTNIVFTPSCAALNGTGTACATVDPNQVFIISNVHARVDPASACDGTFFTITAGGTPTVITLTPNFDIELTTTGGPGFSKYCAIDFDVDVNKVPAMDALPAPGIQTLQVVTAHLEHFDTPGEADAIGGGSTTLPARPLFVIGDLEKHAVGDKVNFWGSQWWKNNFMSGFVNAGYPAFKGYADDSDNACGGEWFTLPGNSSDPPDTIPDFVLVLVTSTVHKDGPNISGDIQQILLVESDGGYGPAPGHRGNGIVRQVLCPLQAP